MKSFPVAVAVSMFLGLASIPVLAASATPHWVGTWGTAPQLVESANMPPSPGLANNTLRQVVRLSIGGDTLRVKFSNDFSTSPVTMKSVNIAYSKGGGAIDAATLKPLTFSGSPSVTMAANSSVFSDPVALSAAARKDIAITIHFGSTSSTVTGHPGSRTTSYLLSGDKSNSADFAGSTKTEHWYVIQTIDVVAPQPAASVAILGNSITDGRGSTTDKQDRWTDILSEALLANPSTSTVGVLNLGIGGNCVVSGGLGPTGASRYQRDILDQRGVAWVVILEGVNDIGGVNSASAATTMSNNLIDAYKKMIADAHARSLKVYGATILPFGGSSYSNQYSESCRKTVNAWVRTSGLYDGVIDFDKTMRSPSDSTKLVSTYQNDGLHPDASGYLKMGKSIDLALFAAGPSGVDGSLRSQPGNDGESATGITVRDGALKIEFQGHRVDGTKAPNP